MVKKNHAGVLKIRSIYLTSRVTKSMKGLWALSLGSVFTIMHPPVASSFFCFSKAASRLSAGSFEFLSHFHSKLLRNIETGLSCFSVSQIYSQQIS